MSTYMKNTDKYGKIWIWTAVVVVLFVPIAVCLYYNAWPEATAVLKGLLGVAPIYWTVGVIEVITYTPMLGTGGTYLAFVTGNLTSIKAPSALSAMENAKVKPGTEEGEVISTIAIATSSMATELVKGKTVEEAKQLTNKAVMEALDGLPPAKVHCSVLAEEAIEAALADYYARRGETYEKKKSCDGCCGSCSGHEH